MAISDKQLVEELVHLIGPDLTVLVANSASRSALILNRWRNDELPIPAHRRQHLEIAHQLANDVAEVRGDDFARAWMAGAGRGFVLTSPVSLIKAGRYDEARRLARLLIEETGER
ncbi:MAG TPA: hypothetical protein VFK03_01000 [Candidatus Saccharimonadales bacterium]|nr:hypothetical protein [Candidatus Saccharimonadales bacterium]